jgi:hypothetical protein
MGAGSTVYNHAIFNATHPGAAASPSPHQPDASHDKNNRLREDPDHDSKEIQAA